MMNIRLLILWELVGSRQDLPAKAVELFLPEGTSVQCLLEAQGIPLKAVGLISVNGSLKQADYILRDRDDVQLYPPLEGG